MEPQPAEPRPAEPEEPGADEPDGPLEFNPFLPEVHADPYPLYRRLQRFDPVHPSFPGVWILTRYADVSTILRDPALFSSDSRNSDVYQAFRQMPEAAAIEKIDQETTRTMLFSDPPDHTRLRTLVSSAFTARRVEGMRQHIQEITDQLLDPIAERGEADLVRELAYPLPIAVICEMLGVPFEDRQLFQRWSQDLVLILDPLVTVDVLDRVTAAVLAFREYFDGLVSERRANPREDLLSALIDAESGGQRLTQQELRSTGILLLVAGHETTVNLISNGTLALLRNPDQLDRLRDEPALIRNAVEEFLRYDSPVQFVGRTLMADWELDGKPIPRGHQVVGIVGAANRDPAQFVDPDRLDIAREDNRHLSFSGGIHFCLGAPLARAEAQVAIGSLVRRFPGLALATEELVWRETVTLRGPRSLQVRTR